MPFGQDLVKSVFMKPELERLILCLAFRSNKSRDSSFRCGLRRPKIKI
ncbi:hypothetical protein AtNW77_Chr5g0090021 [Arabidopsis thaliana]